MTPANMIVSRAIDILCVNRQNKDIRRPVEVEDIHKEEEEAALAENGDDGVGVFF
jgi:hypothetical protein